MASNLLRHILRLGEGGFNKSFNIDTIPSEDLLTAINCEIQDDTLAKTTGTSRWNTNSLFGTGSQCHALKFFPSHKNISFTEIEMNPAVSADDTNQTYKDGVYAISSDDLTNTELKVGYNSYATQNTGWLEFQTFDEDTDGSFFGGTNAWANESNAQSDDSSYATATWGEFNTRYTRAIECKNPNYGTAIPNGSDIVGIEVKMERMIQIGGGLGYDWNVFLIKDDAIVGTNRAARTSDWNSGGATKTYGSSSDDWTANLTLSDVQDSTFGVAFQAKLEGTTSSTHTAQLDYIKIRIYYKEPRRQLAVRFPNVTLPTTGATIVSANLRLTAVGGTSSAINVTIRGIDETDANCNTFSTSAPVTDRPLTDASVTWGIPSTLLADTEYESPDIFSIIQELYDNANWASGQAIGLYVEDIEDEPDVIKHFHSFEEGTAAYKPELYIKYSTESVTTETVIAVSWGGADGRIQSVSETSTHTTLHTYTNYAGEPRETPMIVEGTTSGGKRMFVFSNSDTVEMWDGSAGTTTTITSPPTDWSGTNQPMGGAIHRNRMFAWGNVNEPHTLYYSKVDEHDDFTDDTAGTIQIAPGEGEKIMACISYLGRLFVLKYPTGVFWIDDAAGMDFAAVRKLGDHVGAASPRAIASVGNDALFVGSDGMIHSLRGVNILGDATASQVLPDKLSRWVNDNVSLAELERAAVTFDPVKNTALFLLVTKTRGYPQISLGLDLRNPRKPKLLSFNRDYAYSITTHNNDVYFGDWAGWVQKLDRELYNYTHWTTTGDAYSCEFKTHPIELYGNGQRRASLKELIVVFQGTHQHDVSFDIFVDGTKIDTMTISATGGARTKRIRKRLRGDGYTLAIRGYNENANERFNISKMLVGFKPSNERYQS